MSWKHQGYLVLEFQLCLQTDTFPNNLCQKYSLQPSVQFIPSQWHQLLLFKEALLLSATQYCGLHSVLQQVIMLPSHIASKHPLRQPENIHVSEKNVYFDWNWPNPSSPYYLYLYHLSVILHIHSAKVTAVGQLLCGQPQIGRRSLRMLHYGFDLVKCTLYDM